MASRSVYIGGGYFGLDLFRDLGFPDSSAAPPFLSRRMRPRVSLQILEPKTSLLTSVSYLRFLPRRRR